MSSKKRSFIISGGGTGGHIFPALSIADELKRRYPEANFLFVGAKDRMEMQRVPAAGYNIEGLWISGIQRSNMFKNLSFPFKIISSLMKCRKLIRKVKPDAVIGTGGFASGPLMYTAQKKGIPTVIQEQNSFPGITNKLLASKAKKICVAYEGLERFFPKDRIIETGNPVRQSIVNAFSNEDITTNGANNILILGGSLGAKVINEQTKEIYKDLLSAGFSITWQCGKLYYQALKQEVAEHANLNLTEFLSDMPKAFNNADIIISRAGAGTISELCLVAKPTILIPSPNVAEDHQTKNAQAIANNEAAILLRESNISELKQQIAELANDENKRLSLSTNLKKLAKPDATVHIVNEIEALIN